MLCIGTLLCWHAYDVVFMGCDSHFGTQKNYATITQALGQGYEDALLKQAGGEQSKMADDELVAMDLS